MDIEHCKAIAAAILGEPNVEYVYTDLINRWAYLRNNKFDVLTRAIVTRQREFILLLSGQRKEVKAVVDRKSALLQVLVILKFGKVKSILHSQTMNSYHDTFAQMLIHDRMDNVMSLLEKWLNY